MAVFISYRREDSDGETRAIYNRLAQETDARNLFLDVEAIGAGERWKGRIDDMLASVKAVLEVGSVSETINVTSSSEIINTQNATIAATLNVDQINKMPLPTRNALNASRRKRVSLEDLDAALKETSQLNLVIKGDNSGTVEALESALMNIEVGDDVELHVVHRGVGGVTESDINLATATDNTIVLGFNVRAEGRATELANREGVEVRYYTVIYQAIDEIEQALKGMLKPEYEEVQLGRAEVRDVFKSSKVGTIAGCLVMSGELKRNSKARLIRDNVVIQESLTLTSLRRFKDDVTEVREGFECGLTLGNYGDLRVGDTVETYEMREKPRN